MPRSRALLSILPVVLLCGACSSSSAQAPKDVETLSKEVERLKAEQAELQKSLEEVREFLSAATGGRFGAPSLVNSTFDTSGQAANGDASAPITIVEISDYHCPFCRRHVQQTQPQLYADYVKTGKARHVFVHYPIAQLHPEAHKSHEAASCAGDQGKFWEMHLKLFEAPAKGTDQLGSLAQGIGLDGQAFRTCMESGKYTQAVKESVARVQALKINGTPMFLIGRTTPGGASVTVEKVIEGAQPYPVFKAALDDIASAR